MLLRIVASPCMLGRRKRSQKATLLSLEEIDETVAGALHAASGQTKTKNDCYKDTLHCKTDSLTEAETMKLKETIYQNVYNSELNSTKLVQYNIETGDVKSIHQHSRRIPFALHEKSG